MGQSRELIYSMWQVVALKEVVPDLTASKVFQGAGRFPVLGGNKLLCYLLHVIHGVGVIILQTREGLTIEAQFDVFNNSHAVPQTF